MYGRVAIPPLAAGLGAAGLLPFLAGALFAWLAPEAALLEVPAGYLLVGYAAVILAFVGGAHWGLASAGRPAAPPGWLLGGSVVASLVGWAAMLLAPPPGLALLVIAFLAVLLLDRRAAQERLAPAWWWRLRLRLTLAVIALLIAAIAGLVQAGLFVDG